MFLIIDNTKDLEHAKMTPKLLDYLEVNDLAYSVISRYHELVPYINNKEVMGIILSGGPICLSEKTELRFLSYPSLIILGLLTIFPIIFLFVLSFT